MQVDAVLVHRSERLPDREARSGAGHRMKAHRDVREGESDRDVRPSRHPMARVGLRPGRSPTSTEGIFRGY